MYQRLILTLSPAEQAALTRLAEADLRPPREELRFLLREAAKARHVWLDDPASAEWRGRSAAELDLPWEDV
jgi:hypothetical protein